MDERSAFIRMSANVYHDPDSPSLPEGEIISLASRNLKEIGFSIEAYQIVATHETGRRDCRGRIPRACLAC